MALTSGRLSGNLAKIEWAGTSTAQVQAAEAQRWEFAADFDIEDTTPLASDSPRVDVNMRIPRIIEMEILVTGDNAPGGMPRLPILSLRNTSFNLTMYADKNDLTYYWRATAKMVGFRWGARAPGGKKQRAIFRFVPDGALTNVVGGASTSIE